MIGNDVRDKDAISAVAILCEMAAYEKDKGKSLFEKLIDLYVQYGFYKEALVSITKKGISGQQDIADMMQTYRQNTPKTIANIVVVQILDYQLQTGKNIQTGETWKINLPVSNVLQFVLVDGSKISARPSGTEPKIKFYFSVHAPLNSIKDYEKVNNQLEERLENIIKVMKL